MPVSSTDPRVRRVGFCKLQGEGIDFYAQKYIILIGRKSKTANLDVVIGDNMNISRQHASIEYNFEKKAWELKVHGKNGVTVKNTLYTPSSPPVSLQSGDLLQLGDRAFFFLLEKGSRARQHAPKKRSSLGGVSKPKQQAAIAPPVASQPVPQQQPGIRAQAPAVSVPPHPIAAQASSQPVLLQPGGQQPQPNLPLPLPFLFRHLGPSGIPLAQPGPQSGSAPPAGGNAGQVNVALQQMGLQAILKQQQQLFLQAQQKGQPQAALGGQLTAGAQASPLLQQLIAANAAVSAEGGVAPTPLLPGVPQGFNLLNKAPQQAMGSPSRPAGLAGQAGQQGVPAPFNIPMQMMQRPVMVQQNPQHQQHVASSQIGIPGAQPASPTGQAVRIPFPPGFPAQLLQGLQQHQQLQQQAQEQGIGQNLEQPGGSGPDASEHSSAARQ